jgi:aerobic carbon-monoxide dehydrogenase medium subunit
MKPPPFQYHDPGTLEEALDLLATRENAKLLAGGQSLMAMLNMRYVQPDHLIDINKISGLAYIRQDQDQIHIGAMTRQRELEFSALVVERCPLMHEALANVGHRQTRNRGTIGGSLCHLDPAAELVAVATACDAIIEVRSQGGTRDVAISDFPAFFMTPAIEPDEIVTGIRFRPWPAEHGSAFLELSRRHGDFALVSISVLLDLDGDIVYRVSLTVGGLTHAPQRVTAAEDILRGIRVTAEAIAGAAAVCSRLPANGDIHGSAAYRQHVAGVLAERALALAHRRALEKRGQA